MNHINQFVIVIITMVTFLLMNGCASREYADMETQAEQHAQQSQSTLLSEKSIMAFQNYNTHAKNTLSATLIKEQTNDIYFDKNFPAETRVEKSIKTIYKFITKSDKTLDFPNEDNCEKTQRIVTTTNHVDNYNYYTSIYNCYQKDGPPITIGFYLNPFGKLSYNDLDENPPYNALMTSNHVYQFLLSEIPTMDELTFIPDNLHLKYDTVIKIGSDQRPFAPREKNNIEIRVGTDVFYAKNLDLSQINQVKLTNAANEWIGYLKYNQTHITINKEDIKAQKDSYKDIFWYEFLDKNMTPF